MSFICVCDDFRKSWQIVRKAFISIELGNDKSKSYYDKETDIESRISIIII